MHAGAAHLLQLADAGLVDGAEQRLLATHVHVRAALVNAAQNMCV